MCKTSDIEPVLIKELKKYFGHDGRRIDHALKVLAYAKRIRAAEGGDMDIVTAAAILHDVGIKVAENKYGSSAGKYQEIEGPPVAKAILQQHDIGEDHIDHISQIIGNHHSGKAIDTPEFRCIWDADWLVNLSDTLIIDDTNRLKRFISRVLRTQTGKNLAADIYLKE